LFKHKDKNVSSVEGVLLIWWPHLRPTEDMKDEPREDQ